MLESYIFRQISAKTLPNAKATLFWRLSFWDGQFCKSLSSSAGFTYRLYRLDSPIGYIGLNLGPQDPRGPQKTVVRIESMTGIRSFRLNFVKSLCLNYYSRNLVLFIFRSDNAKSSNEFP